MSAAFGAIAPVFLLLVLGLAFGRRRFPAVGFWPAAERLVYWCLFPALLLRTTAGVESGGALMLGIALAVLGPIGLVMALVTLGAPRLGLAGRMIPAIAQAATRQNVYIAFAAALGLWGEPALAPLAIAVAAYVPGVNIASALLLGLHAATRPRPAALARALLLNPLVLASAAGLVLGQTGYQPPWVLDETLRVLATASLPLALLATGAGLVWQDTGRRELAWLAAASAFKLAGLPLLTLATALTLGLPPLPLAVVVLFASLPLSPTAYVQTRAMGGHAGFMANAVALQTLLAMASLPVVMGLLEGWRP